MGSGQQEQRLCPISPLKRKKAEPMNLIFLFSRQQLADYLAVERSGLSVELCKMRDEGLLEFHKSHFVLKV